MSPRTRPPFRADHVGSLLRPKLLLDARAAHAASRLDGAGLRAVEDVAVRDVVRMQEELGLPSATDGELRRTSWHLDFIYQLRGVTRSAEQLTTRRRNAAADLDQAWPALQVNDRIALDETIFGWQFEFLQSAVTTATAKLTIPSPSMVHFRAGPAAIDPSVYPDEEEFWADLSHAYAQQIAGLAGLGCTYLQLDDPSLAYLNDPAQRAQLQAKGGDAEHQHERYIRQVNAAVAQRPAGLAVTIHLCRGNVRSTWMAAGGYEFVAEALFSELDVDGFLLEYDDARSGGFEPLRFVPPGKQVVLGLVTTKHPRLESKDDLKRRIDAAARYVPLEQLGLSGQCGFSSTVEGNALTLDDQRAKLRLIVETAAEVWG